MTENAAVPASTIVVVDDHIDAADALGALLTSCGFRVFIAYGARAALRLVEDLHPDVLVSDLEMPGMSGLEEAAAVRRLPAWCQPRMVALTGAVDADMRRRAMEAGFDACLSKPAELDELLNAIHAAVDPCRTGPAVQG